MTSLGHAHLDHHLVAQIAVQETYPQILCAVDRTRVDTMPHNAGGLSGRSLMTSLGEEKDSSFNRITGNWVMNCKSIVGNW